MNRFSRNFEVHRHRKRGSAIIAGYKCDATMYLEHGTRLQYKSVQDDYSLLSCRTCGNLIRRLTYVTVTTLWRLTPLTHSLTHSKATRLALFIEAFIRNSTSARPSALGRRLSNFSGPAATACLFACKNTGERCLRGTGDANRRRTETIRVDRTCSHARSL